MEKKAPSGTFPYGYGKIETLSGLFIVLLIVASALATGTGAIMGLSRPRHIGLPALAMGVALIGIIVNLIVARMRIHAGRASGSESLVADGHHAGADALTAFGVLAGIVASRYGFPRLDSLIGLGITAALLSLSFKTGRGLLIKLLDGADPEIPIRISGIVAKVPGVARAGEVRARWVGRSLHAEINLSVADPLDVIATHDRTREVRHTLLHQGKGLGAVMIHIDPEKESGEDCTRMAPESHDGLPLHSH